MSSPVYIRTPLLQVLHYAFRDMHIYDPPGLLNKFGVSLGCHLLNLSNYRATQRGNGIMDGALPRNYRMSLSLMAPSGFSKSTFHTLLADRAGLLNGPFLRAGVEGTFTPESWVGTRLSREDAEADPSAVFAYYSTGIVAADEFERLLYLMEGDGSTTEEVYLLQGLDKPEIYKHHSLGGISHTGICTTIWPAMRPPPIPMRMTSGLARRFMFALYLPGPDMWDDLKTHMRTGNRTKPTVPFSGHRASVQAELEHIINTLPDNIPEVHVYDKVDEWCDSHDQPSFMEGIFQRIALGASVVRGQYPDIIVDEFVEGMFMDEIRARSILKYDPMAYAVRNIVRGFGPRGEPEVRDVAGNMQPSADRERVEEFMRTYYQLSAVQVSSAIQQALSYGLVVHSGNRLLLHGGPVI